MDGHHIPQQQPDRAWLLTWNEDNWTWDDYAGVCESTRMGQTFADRWACTSTAPRVGDEFFLMKLGRPPRGIVGHGLVRRPSYEAEHYDPAKAAQGKTMRCVDIEFDCLLDYRSEAILSQDDLKARCAAQHWSPQSSGIEIKPEVLQALRSLWRETVGVDDERFGFAEIVSFLADYSGSRYVPPEKAGDQTEAMEEMRLRGWDARERFIAFGKSVVARVSGLEFVSCSNWVNQGQAIERDLWIQLKRPEWMGSPQSVTMSVELHGDMCPGDGWCLSVRAETKDVSDSDVDYQGQQRLLECDLLEGMTYRAKYRDQSYHDLGEDTELARRLCGDGTIRKLEVIECVDDLLERDAAGTVLSEAVRAATEILPLYDHVMGGVGWWPTLADYNPGISVEDYGRVLRGGYEESPEALSTLYYLHRMGGSGTCKDVARQFGGSPSAYVARANAVMHRVADETGCPVQTREDGEPRLWPVLFYGREVGVDEDRGNFEWRLREPLVEAIASMEADGFFDGIANGGGTMLNRFDRNMILYGPPGTGKTYGSAIWAVAICDDRPVDEVRADPYADVLARYDELRGEGRVRFTTFHQSYGYEEFVEGIRPVTSDGGGLRYEVADGIFKSLCNTARGSALPHVLVIDEINRGNVSKVLGELITLLEEDKREGARHAMEATLAYSGEGFSVPANVYVVGTMNTADRSIALMDTALRRRFSFVEVMPSTEALERMGVARILIGGVELDVAGMLDAMNRRIECLYDREHAIGHAFFSRLAEEPTVEALADIFEGSVVPLLQEYFYEDYEKIQLVLGDNAKEDSLKLVLDRPLKARDIFCGSPDVDLPERSYGIQRSAFLRIESYVQICRDE